MQAIHKISPIKSWHAKLPLFQKWWVLMKLTFNPSKIIFGSIFLSIYMRSDYFPYKWLRNLKRREKRGSHPFDNTRCPSPHLIISPPTGADHLSLEKDSRERCTRKHGRPSPSLLEHQSSLELEQNPLTLKMRVPRFRVLQFKVECRVFYAIIQGTSVKIRFHNSVKFRFGEILCFYCQIHIPCSPQWTSFWELHEAQKPSCLTWGKLEVHTSVDFMGSPHLGWFEATRCARHA